jgi:predicted kinase
MELVVLIGIPASGKSSFASARLSTTHLRLNRDMLKTINRERRLFETCLGSGTAVVIDNTNVTVAERAAFIIPARAVGFRVVGYFFESRVRDALVRNERRGRPVPDVAVKGRSGQLELPRLDEGFDALFFVRLSASGGFDVETWDETR